MLLRALAYIVATLLAFFCGNSGSDQVHIEVMGAGIIEDCVQESRPDPNGQFPYVHVSRDCKVIDQTDVVPARVGTSFGMVFRARSSAPAVELSFEWKTPDLENPASGRTFSGWSHTSVVATNRELSEAFRFDQSWELVPGDWAIRILRQRELLHETVFRVQPP